MALLLEGIAKRSATSQEEVLKNAIIQYDSYDKWVREQIEQGLKEAEAGNLLPNNVVEQEMKEMLLNIKNRYAD